jgi:serine/threonine-protein kinase
VAQLNPLPHWGRLRYEQRYMWALRFVWCCAALLAAAAPADDSMVVVPAGEFVRGDAEGEPDERPPQRVQLPAFAIDRTEVTVESYSECVQKNACRPPGGPKAPAGAPAGLPVVNVSWQDAAAYCAFAGKRLPTEAEWEKAARGTDGRRYPWGSEFSCARGNFGNYAGDGRCADEGAPGHPVPVGSFPSGASPYGALDMAGNVWEWVADQYAPDAYKAYKRPPPPLAQARVADEKLAGNKGAPRVLHGGGCCSIFGLPRSADRLALPPTYRDSDIGFRCARSLGAP